MTNMSGAYRDYMNMFKAIVNWGSSNNIDLDGCDEHEWLHSIGWGLNDAGFYGWGGEALKNEYRIFEKVKRAYCLFLKSLAEAVGYQFADNDYIWKYCLKDVDTDVLLARGEEDG